MILMDLKTTEGHALRVPMWATAGVAPSIDFRCHVKPGNRLIEFTGRKYHSNHQDFLISDTSIDFSITITSTVPLRVTEHEHDSLSRKTGWRRSAVQAVTSKNCKSRKTIIA